MNNLHNVQFRFSFRLDTLSSKCINVVLENMNYFRHDLESLSCLPGHIKDIILKRYALKVSSCFYEKENEEVLSVLLHSDTKRVQICGCNDKILDYLSKCKNLRYLCFEQIANNFKLSESERDTYKISDIGFENFFKGVNRLQFLYIPWCESLNDAAVVSLVQNCPLIKELDFTRCTSLTDEALREVAKLKYLTCLSVSHTKITDLGIYYLVNGNSALNLNELRINDCENITDDSIIMIIEKCENITTLCFHNTSVNNYENCFNYMFAKCKKMVQINWSV